MALGPTSTEAVADQAPPLLGTRLSQKAATPISHSQCQQPLTCHQSPQYQTYLGPRLMHGPVHYSSLENTFSHFEN